MRRKRMTIQITGLLTAVFLLFLTVQPILAADGEQSISIRRLPDGSYYETIVETAPSQPGALTSSRIFAPSGVYTVKKSKTTRYRSASGSVLWFVKVTGTFRYGKGSSTCLSSYASFVSPGVDFDSPDKALRPFPEDPDRDRCPTGPSSQGRISSRPSSSDHRDHAPRPPVMRQAPWSSCCASRTRYDPPDHPPTRTPRFAFQGIPV